MLKKITVFIPMKHTENLDKVDTAIWKYNGFNSDKPKQFVAGAKEEEGFFFSEEDLKRFAEQVWNDAITTYVTESSGIGRFLTNTALSKEKYIDNLFKED